MVAQGKAPGTVKKMLSLLGGMFQVAVEDDSKFGVEFNPVRDVKVRGRVGEVKAIEDYRERDCVAAFYYPPDEKLTRKGIFYANTFDAASRPRFNMPALAIHEAVPGHHLQIARAQELPGLPAFRRSGGYVAYSEGWALYAESLGHEMGFYEDPYMRYGALAMEMMRACRLVIDTGLHSKDWGREQSIRYLMENAGLKQAFASAEVDRYINNPGQALGYKIGELRIKALRARAAQALGERFDLRRFHDLGTRTLDHHLRGRGRRPKPTVQAAVTNCDPDAFGPVLRAKRWSGLADDTRVLSFPEPQTTVSPLAEPRGPAADPVTTSLSRGRGCLTTDLPQSAGIATYTAPVGENDVLMAGLPRLRFRFDTVASDLELNARLWEVAPDGTQTLVDRGAYRAVGATGGATADYELFGNAWRFQAGNEMMLEITQDDSTYLRRDNFPSTATISGVELAIPEVSDGGP